MIGIRSLSRNILEDTLSKVFVLPNRLVIPMVTDFNINELNGIQSIKPKVIKYH
jgi:hypothetical protein